jgi:hypothetical protein
VVTATCGLLALGSTSTSSRRPCASPDRWPFAPSLGFGGHEPRVPSALPGSGGRGPPKPRTCRPSPDLSLLRLFCFPGQCSGLYLHHPQPIDSRVLDIGFNNIDFIFFDGATGVGGVTGTPACVASLHLHVHVCRLVATTDREAPSPSSSPTRTLSA